MRSLVLKVFWVTILCCFSAACSGQETSNVAVITETASSMSSSTETPTNTPVPTSTPTPKPSQTAVSTETLAPHPTLTPSTTATSTPSATYTLSPTATSTSLPFLDVRYPTVEELEAYLLNISSEEFRLHTPFTANAKFIFEDVNGDREEDLIVSDFMTIGVLVWDNNHYRKPFLIQKYPGRWEPSSHIYLEDWTNDGVPEVVFDYRIDGGVTGVRYADWTKFIIHCPPINEESCNVAWSGKIAAITNDYNGGGLDLYQASLDRNTNEDGLISLYVTTNAFAIYSWGWHLAPNFSDSPIISSLGDPASGFPNDYYLESLNVYTSTLSVFTWDGNTFLWQDTEILEPTDNIDAQNSLEAVNNEGQTAIISAEFNGAPTYQNDSCQLIIDGTLAGTKFGCKQNFTTVYWQDITGDGQEELVIIALSGAYDEFGDHLSDKNCVHQRLLVYQQTNSQLIEIANITGCVMQSDLYGVEVQDVDGDGQVEILAVDGVLTEPNCDETPYAIEGIYCWYELGHQDEIYKWNGSEFVYSGLLSE